MRKAGKGNPCKMEISVINKFFPVGVGSTISAAVPGKTLSVLKLGPIAGLSAENRFNPNRSGTRYGVACEFGSKLRAISSCHRTSLRPCLAAALDPLFQLVVAHKNAPATFERTATGGATRCDTFWLSNCTFRQIGEISPGNPRRANPVSAGPRLRWSAGTVRVFAPKDPGYDSPVFQQAE